MPVNIPLRRELSFLKEIDLLPFITLKYLSDKQEENIDDISDFEEKYGFSFRDYELLSNIIKKYQSDDKTFETDFKSAINALRNSRNEYIKYIYSNISDENLTYEILSKITSVLSSENIGRLINYSVYFRDKRFYQIRDLVATPRLTSLMVDIAKTSHEIVNVYDPTCRTADVLKFLDDFKTVVLYEYNSNLYSQALSNIILKDIPLEKVSIHNDLKIDDDSKDKYDTIISIPYSKVEIRKRNQNKSFDKQLKDLEFRHLKNLLRHLDEKGIIVTVTTQDILVKKDTLEFRKKLIEENLIDSIIEYQKTLRDSDIILLVLKNDKKTEDILFIKQKDRMIRLNHKKILDCYTNRNKIPLFSDVITNEEIIENDYNLNPKRYVYTLEYKSKNVDELLSRQENYKEKVKQLDEEIDKILEEIKQ